LLAAQHLGGLPGAKHLEPSFAFELLATYGFPLDLTAIAAAQRGLVSRSCLEESLMPCWLQELDDEAVALLMQQHKDLGKQSWASSSAAALPPGDWQLLNEELSGAQECWTP
jgi:alanyl-tRNA synthetase